MLSKYLSYVDKLFVIYLIVQQHITIKNCYVTYLILKQHIMIKLTHHFALCYISFCMARMPCIACFGCVRSHIHIRTRTLSLFHTYTLALSEDPTHTLCDTRAHAGS